jgi:hypothetical protein
MEVSYTAAAYTGLLIVMSSYQAVLLIPKML